ncbi:hypothetical protein PINS_up010875 [Pythium insidiosum]|nr:hypothetical protein PINS_up010875 [Pythium insidiosum]
MAASKDSSSRNAAALRVKNLPGVLSDDAISSLLTRYGAVRVRVLRRPRDAVRRSNGETSRTPLTAVAEFASRDAQQSAREKLSSVDLAGFQLVVETLQTNDTEDSDATTREKPAKASPANRPAASEASSVAASRAMAPVPLAPHLGLHYAPSPLLHYKYPRASVPIVRNIANALLALPRFYTQVLHLMNKMNLPPPFEDDAIRGPFSLRNEQSPAVSNGDHHKRSLDIEEEGEEEEEDEEDTENANQQQAPTSVPALAPPSAVPTVPTISRPRKRQRASKASRAALPSPTTAFTASSPASQSSSCVAPRADRPGVITTKELLAQRRPRLDQTSAHSSPSTVVRVEALPPTVDARDIEYVMAYVLPPETPLSALSVELLADGVALARYPTVEMARDAVETLQGVVVDEQPLRLEEAPSSPASRATAPSSPASTSFSAETLRQSRLSADAMAQEKALRNYARGDPSAALYVKNLPRSVRGPELLAICAALLPSPSPPTIRHFADGRMKNQAFVELETVEQATLLLEELHGIVVDQKTLVVVCVFFLTLSLTLYEAKPNSCLALFH